MRGGQNAHLLAIGQSFGEVAFEFDAVIGLPDQIAQADSVTLEVLLDARGEHGTGGGTAFLSEGPKQQATADFPGLRPKEVEESPQFDDFIGRGPAVKTNR